MQSLKVLRIIIFWTFPHIVCRLWIRFKQLNNFNCIKFVISWRTVEQNRSNKSYILLYTGSKIHILVKSILSQFYVGIKIFIYAHQCYLNIWRASRTVLEKLKNYLTKIQMYLYNNYYAWADTAFCQQLI